MTGIQYNNKILVKDDKILTLRDEVISNLQLYSTYGRIYIDEVWRHGKMLYPNFDNTNFPINLLSSNAFTQSGGTLIREPGGIYIAPANDGGIGSNLSSQEIIDSPLIPNEDYTFIFTAKFIRPITRRVELAVLGANPQIIFREDIDYTTEWKNYAISFKYDGTPITLSHRVRFVISTNDDNYNNTLHVKNIGLFKGNNSDQKYFVHPRFLLTWSDMEAINTTITKSTSTSYYLIGSYVPGDTHIYITIKYGEDWSESLEYHF